MMPLIGPGPASASGQNLVSLPWAVDTTLRNAEDVMRDIGFANTVNVLNFLTATDTYQAYTGRKGSPSSAFPLVDTVGYLVKVTTTQYWAPRDQASVHCEFMSGTFPAGNPDALATAFCADYAAHVPGPMSPFADFTCAKQASPPGKIKLTILGVPPNPPVPGPAVCVPPPTNYGIVFSGTTTVPHPYGYSMCCNSPLSQSMGTDGNRPVSIDFGTHDFNEFSVTTSSEGGTTTQVPALGVGWMIALVAALVAVGLWLRSR
jgi:hypothetical protein